MKAPDTGMAPAQRAKRPARALARLAAALLLTLALAGCASGPPAPMRPAVATPVAQAWQAHLPPAGPSIDAADHWARWGDPALPGLIQAAQRASPSVSAAAARIERARATRATAAALLLPQLNATGSAVQARSAPGQRTATSASLGAQAAWEIDLFGAGAAGRSAAQARLRGAQALLEDARTAVAAEVATSSTALRACEAQRGTSQQDADSRLETARLTDLSAGAGFTAPADAALARAGAAQARASATQQRAQCDVLVKSLVELTDLSEPELRQRLAPGTAQLPQAGAMAVPALPAGLLTRRPDLFEAARAVEAAAGDLGQTEARERPQISLSGTLGGLSLRSGGETVSGASWSIGPLVVSLPLFDGGTRRANTAAARAAYDDALVQYQAQVRRAVREVETSLVALQSTAERSDDASRAAAGFEAFLRATEARQKGGLASLFDLENARRNAVAAESALIELQRERASAWIALFRALGGGWIEPTTGGNAWAASMPTPPRP